MRIKTDLSLDRDQFVYNLFVANPQKSVKEANELLFNRDNKRMALDRLYQLYHAAQEGKPMPAKLTTEERKVLTAERAERSAARKARKAAEATITAALTPEPPAEVVVDTNITTTTESQTTETIDVVVAPTSTDTTTEATI